MEKTTIFSLTYLLEDLVINSKDVVLGQNGVVYWKKGHHLGHLIFIPDSLLLDDLKLQFHIC